MEDDLIDIPRNAEDVDCGEHGIVVTALIQSKGQVIACHQSGYLSLPLLKEITDHNLIICELINDVLRIQLTKDLESVKKKDVAELGNFMNFIHIEMGGCYKLPDHRVLRSIIHSITNNFS